MKRVVLIGAKGQLGSDLAQHLDERSESYKTFALCHEDLEITDHAETEKQLKDLAPNIVINTAAFHKVDECESNAFQAFRVNTLAVGNLAEVCRAIDAELVHLSTDYVFGTDSTRKTPYTEDDPPGPINIYGLSKLSGEYLIKATLTKYFIIRTAGLYGTKGSREKRGNFVELMLRLAREGTKIRVVNDQTTAPTYTKYLAGQIIHMLDIAPWGLYHATCQGQCTWYAFAKKVFELSGITADVKPQTTALSGAKARRPSYSVLDNAALEKSEADIMPDWEAALKEYLAREY